MLGKIIAKFNKVILRARMALSNDSGQGAVDTAVQVLIAIVLGALLLGGLYLILNGIVMLNVTKRIQEMFNFKM